MDVSVHGPWVWISPLIAPAFQILEPVQTNQRKGVVGTQIAAGQVQAEMLKNIERLLCKVWWCQEAPNMAVGTRFLRCSWVHFWVTMLQFCFPVVSSRTWFHKRPQMTSRGEDGNKVIMLFPLQCASTVYAHTRTRTHTHNKNDIFIFFPKIGCPKRLLLESHQPGRSWMAERGVLVVMAGLLTSDLFGLLMESIRTSGFNLWNANNPWRAFQDMHGEYCM